jgi:hypothetical protein
MTFPTSRIIEVFVVVIVITREDSLSTVWPRWDSEKLKLAIFAREKQEAVRALPRGAAGRVVGCCVRDCPTTLIHFTFRLPHILRSSTHFPFAP